MPDLDGERVVGHEARPLQREVDRERALPALRASRDRDSHPAPAGVVECNAATANAKARPFTLQWGTTPKVTFKVTSYRHVSCLNDPAVPGAPNGFDTQTGDADGTLDGVAGHRLEWSIVDGGAMSNDRIQARIVRVSDGTVIRTISGAPSAGIGHIASVATP